MIMSTDINTVPQEPERPKKASRTGLWVLATVLAASAATGAALYTSAPSHSESPAAKAAPPPPSVSVATIEPRQVMVWDEFSGRLEAVDRVDVRSRVAGTVQEVHFREGALVEKGARLFTIDPAPYAAEVERLEAQVASAEARVVFTRTEAERARRLLGSPAHSERDVDQRANAYNEAEAALRAAKAALQAARLNLEYTEVKAPVAGRVGRLEVTIGNLVAAGPSAPVLTNLVSINPIYASFNADEATVSRVLSALSPEANAAAEVGAVVVEISNPAANGAWVNGRLQLIDNQVDATSGTVRLRAIFDNADGRLIPGQFVRVRMAQPRNAPVVAVSERAIGTDQSKRFVIVVGGDNKAAYREITLGSMADGLRIVTSGLDAGERIVVSGLQRVRPGAVVSPEPASMERMTSNDVHTGTIQTKSTQQ
jgi:multidrug efflux system membrane fusion protein